MDPGIAAFRRNYHVFRLRRDVAVEAGSPRHTYNAILFFRRQARDESTAKETRMSDYLNPGSFVRLDGKPDWGIGQIQTVIGPRVTVNFEHAGKQLINTDRVSLQAVDNGTSVR